MDTLQSFLENGGAKVLLWLASALLSYLTLLVRAKIKNDNARTFLLRVFDEVDDAVRSVTQTHAAGWRTPEGKLDTEAQTKAKNLAMSTVRSNLGPKNLAKLKKTVGVDVDKWLSTRIEATVHDHKLKNGVKHR